MDEIRERNVPTFCNRQYLISKPVYGAGFAARTSVRAHLSEDSEEWIATRYAPPAQEDAGTARPPP